jgi:hypothetical protein
VAAGVAAARIFVLEPKELAAARKDKARPSRVDFSIH